MLELRLLLVAWQVKMDSKWDLFRVGILSVTLVPEDCVFRDGANF